MPRFFVEKERISEKEIIIDGADAHHIARSLRMAEGDEVTICDGSGKEYSCTLCRIRDEECIAEIHEVSESLREPKMKVTLCMAYPKGDKLETVIQKAVELGATEIIPFDTSVLSPEHKAKHKDWVFSCFYMSHETLKSTHTSLLVSEHVLIPSQHLSLERDN